LTLGDGWQKRAYVAVKRKNELASPPRQRRRAVVPMNHSTSQSRSSTPRLDTTSKTIPVRSMESSLVIGTTISQNP
jgi:hypothetical protein